MIARIVLTGVVLLGVLPARASDAGMCRGDVRNLDREMTLRADRLSPTDRVLAEQRLSRAEGLCAQDSTRARQDLEQLRRDMVQQATRPGDVPGLPRTGLERN